VAPPAPPVQLGPGTRWCQGIIQKKVRTDGTVAWSSILAEQIGNEDTAEPRDYREAIRIPHWHDAMEDEFSALGSWYLLFLVLI
jgi:hypothetical protein